MASGKRAGLQTVHTLPEDMRRILEPLQDRVARMSGDVNSTRKLPDLNVKRPKAVATLSGAATLAQTITKVNEILAQNDEIIAILLTTVSKLNDVITRLQED